MNIDPFGHVACARHFLDVAKRDLAKAKTEKEKFICQLSIDRLEKKIKAMVHDEIEFWRSFQN